MARRKSALELVRPDAGGAPSRRNRINFFELAYQRIEDLLVNCELKPGRFLTVQELQDVTGFGRTPVHNAVNQFAADTLIITNGYSCSEQIAQCTQRRALHIAEVALLALAG